MRLKSIFKYFLSLCLLLIGIYIYLILFPQILFSNKIEYKNFKIYSNDKIDDNINVIIDNVIVQLKTSSIYDSTVPQKVFFIDNSFYYTMTKFYNKERAGFHEFLVNNSMVVPQVDVKDNTITYSDGKVRNLAQTIIHETVHSMQENKLGFWRVIKIPEWKIEGYAFYIAKTNLILNNGHLSYQYVRKNLEDLGKHSNHKHYWMYGVMTGYILNEKNFTFDQFISDNVKEDETVKEVVNWYFNNSPMQPQMIGMK
jgi:hypothetical protein